MRDRPSRKAKEKAEAKRKLAPTIFGEIDFTFDDDFVLGDIFFPAVTPPPVPVFTSYDSHPYFVAIDEINSVIRDIQLGNGFHELLLKGIAKAQRENLVHAKEQAIYEHDKNTFQELIDRIDRTLLHYLPLTSDNLWDFKCPGAALLQQADEKAEKLKRARTDPTDNMERLEYPFDPILDGLDDLDAPLTADFYNIENLLLPPALLPPAAFLSFQLTTPSSSFAKIISTLEKPHTENQKRPESPSSGEETVSSTSSPVLKEAARIPVENIHSEFSLRSPLQRDTHQEEQKNQLKK